jgi:2-iminoacetate synthase ThiH
MGAISVTFYDVSGSPIAPGTIRTDASSAVAKYFAGSDLGGVFLLDAVYPVTGDVTRVASCEATLINSAGSSRTQRTTF